MFLNSSRDVCSCNYLINTVDTVGEATACKSLCAVAMETRLKWLIGRSSELGASHEGKSLRVCL